MNTFFFFLSQWQATSDDAKKRGQHFVWAALPGGGDQLRLLLSRKIGFQFQVLMSQFIIDGNSTSISPFT